jgi:DNA-binding transcriptional ArsR family regulator
MPLTSTSEPFDRTNRREILKLLAQLVEANAGNLERAGNGLAVSCSSTRVAGITAVISAGQALAWCNTLEAERLLSVKRARDDFSVAIISFSASTSRAVG